MIMNHDGEISVSLTVDASELTTKSRVRNAQNDFWKKIKHKSYRQVDRDKWLVFGTVPAEDSTSRRNHLNH